MLSVTGAARQYQNAAIARTPVRALQVANELAPDEIASHSSPHFAAKPVNAAVNAPGYP